MSKIRKAFRRSPFAFVAFVCSLIALISVASISFARVRPTNSSTLSSVEEFRHSGVFPANYVCDRPVVWLPVIGGNQLYVADGDSDSNLDAPIGLGAGTPSFLEINTSEIGGFTLDADDESVSFLWPLPADIDLTQAVQVRILWSNSEAAGTGTAAWAVTYKELIVGTTALAVAATAADSDGAAVVDKAANIPVWSNWSTIAASSFSGTPGTDVVNLKAAVDLTTIANATAYGIQIRYYRQFLGCDSAGF